MMKIIALVILCLLTQGCVGVGALRTRTETFQDPYLSDTGCADCLGSRDRSETNAPAYTATWLEAHWGKPKSISHAGAGGQDETWTYKFGLNWNGVVLVVLIPIPIAVPVGRERVLFVVRDGRVISAEQRRSQTVGGAVGYSIGPCGINKFGTFSLED